jgi:aspartate aminotransferase
MSHFVDCIPSSGIIRIRDMMYGVENPYRLDQGDVSFDAPDSVKRGMVDAIAANHTHYLQTTGVPKLQQLLAAKLRERNAIPVESPDEVLVTNGGVHAVYLLFQSLLDPGDEVLIPDPLWPPTAGTVAAARGTVVRYPLREAQGWRFDHADLEARVTPRTRVVYLNSPHNPTGGVLTLDDLEHVARLARERDLWVVSDEAYEDVAYDGSHVRIPPLPPMYARTVPVYTFSKSYAMTGLRLGYLALHDARLRDRVRKLLFFTTSNVSSVVQYGGIGALQGPRDVVDAFRGELRARRDLFFEGIERLGGIFSGKRPAGAFYAFLRFDPAWRARATLRLGPAAIPRSGQAVAGRDRDEAGGRAEGGNGGERSAGEGQASESWALTEYLISRGRIGCVPGVDFGPGGEGYIRFCYARERAELQGALAAMAGLFE